MRKDAFTSLHRTSDSAIATNFYLSNQFMALRFDQNI